jgi:exonuclease SbcC
MKIWELHLKNVKSYHQCSVRFHDGVNFISGVNGAGKTTIIESIGFALFNYLPYTSKEFVREGEQQGEIEVLFEGNDERLYRIKRKFSRSQKTIKWEAYDEESGSLLTDIHGSNDMEVWLKPLLGMDHDVNLAETFREIIAVDQGLFTAPFLYTETQRRSLFDKILKVEGYREAFKNSSGIERVFMDVLKVIEGELKGLEDQLDRLPHVEEQLQLQRVKLAETEQNFAQSTAILTQAEGKLRQLEDLKKQMETLDYELASLSEQRRRFEADQLHWKTELQQAVDAGERLEEAKEGYELYLKHQKTLKELELLKSQKDQWVKVQQQSEKSWAAEKAATQGEENAIGERKLELDQKREERKTSRSSWQVASKRSSESLMRWKDRVRLSDEIERAYEKVIHSIRPTAEALLQLRDRISQRQEWTERLETINDSLVELERLEKEWKDFPLQEAERDRIQESLGGLQARRDTLLQNQKHLLEGQCPIIEEACPSEKVSGDLTGFFEKAVEQLEQQKESLLAQLQECDQRNEKRQALERRILELKPYDSQKEEGISKSAALMQSIDQLAALLDVKPLEVILADYVKQVTDYERNLIDSPFLLQLNKQRILDGANTHWESFLASLSQLKLMLLREQDKVEPSMVVALIEKGRILSEWQEQHRQAWRKDREAILQQLREAETEERLLQSQLEKDELDEEKDSTALRDLALRNEKLTQRREALTLLERELAEWDSKLQPLAGIETEILSARDQQEAFEGDFRKYTENLKWADRRSEYEQKQQETVVGLGLLESSIQEKEMKQAQLRQVYSVDGYLQAKEEQQHSRDQHVSLKVQVEAQHKELQHIQEEWERLRAIQKRVEERLLLKQRKEKALQWTKMIRKVLNDAGEPIADVFRRFISKEANRIHREISNENVELRWGEGYELLLADRVQGRERERVFKQLSGGEQMTAALAVRLALLRYLSDTKLGFFDEPTANLDVQRRQSLSQAIQNGTEGFDQLFVISHDDAFEAMTENTIYLSKDRGTGAAVS